MDSSRVKLEDVLWPRLPNWSGAPTAEEEEATTRDSAELMRTSWGILPRLALSQATGIANYEEARRKTAENKASTCLLVVAGLVPLLTYAESVTLQSTHFSPLVRLTGPLLILGLAYLIASGLWALRAIEVGKYAVLGTQDMSRIWGAKQNILEQLVRELLVAIRSNQDAINKKISAYKMANEFLYRAIITLSLVLGIQVGCAIYLG